MTSTAVRPAAPSRRRRAMSALVAAATAVVLGGVAAAPAADATGNGPVTYQPVAGTGATVTLDHGTYEPGATVTVTGTGFLGTDGEGGVHVVVKPDDGGFAVASYGGTDAVHPGDAGGLATFSSHDDGTFTGTLTLPEDLPADGPGTGEHAGQHWLRLLAGSFGNPTAATSFQAWFAVASPHVAPVVTTQPQGVAVVAGQDATFTAAATGSPTPTVQWERQSRGGTWAAVDGATSTTLTVRGATTALSGTRYRAVFTSAGDSVTTDAAQLVATSVTLDHASYEPGGTVRIEGAGYVSADGSGGVQVVVKSDDGVTFAAYGGADAVTPGVKGLPTFSTADDGTFSGTVTLPDDVAGGSHALRVLSGSFGTAMLATSVAVPFTVTSGTGSTGGDDGDGETGGDTGGADAGDGDTDDPGLTDGTTYPGTSDPSVTFTAPSALVEGDEIVLSGTGWTTTDGSAGSVVAVKLDDGAISTTGTVTNPADGSAVGNRTVFAMAAADAQGRWTARIPFPTTSTSTTAADWAVGETHSIRLLTGSFRAGDKVRSETASFTVVAAGTGCADGQVLVSHTTGKQTATVCVQQAVTTGAGKTLTVTGRGWLTTDGKAGSTVVLKLASRATPSSADFQFVHTGTSGDAVLTHPTNGSKDPTIWAVGKADADGTFTATLPVPQQRNVPGNVDAAQGALTAGSKLVVHFQAGLRSGDTQHTVDSEPLVVDGVPYGGDRDAAVVPCTASGGFEAHLVTPAGQKVDPVTGPVVSWGDTVEVAGTGWCNADPAKGGSVIGIKLDDGAYSRRTGELVNANPQVWAVVEVDSADGSFDATITLPRKGDVAGGSAPAFAEGAHTLRLLTGSLKSGDPIRTAETGTFTVGTYRPNGLPDLVEADEDLTRATAHGVTATVGKSAVTVHVPAAGEGDWAFLTAYLPDGSVRYPWADTWFRADGAGTVTARLAGATLPTGTWKLAVQRPDGSVLGWATVTVAGASTGSGSGSEGGGSKPASTSSPSGGDGADGRAGSSSDGTSGGGATSSTGATAPSGTTTPAGTTVTPAATAVPAPTTTPAPPVADGTGLTTKNAHGVTGTQDGTVVTLTLPSGVEPGDWVFVYVYSTPTAVGWVQVDADRRVRVDLGLMEPGVHKVAVLDAEGTLVGWAPGTVAAAENAAATDAGAVGAAPAAGGQPTTASATAGSGIDTADAWLLMVAFAVLVGAAVAIAVVRSRRDAATQA